MFFWPVLSRSTLEFPALHFLRTAIELLYSAPLLPCHYLTGCQDLTMERLSFHIRKEHNRAFLLSSIWPSIYSHVFSYLPAKCFHLFSWLIKQSFHSSAFFSITVSYHQSRMYHWACLARELHSQVYCLFLHLSILLIWSLFKVPKGIGARYFIFCSPLHDLHTTGQGSITRTVSAPAGIRDSGECL